MFEIDAILKEPEFTTRTNQFLNEVELLGATDFPEILIEAINRTLRDLDTAPAEIFDLETEIKDRNYTLKERARDRETEIESASKNTAEINFYSNSPVDMAEFILEVDEMAKELKGNKISEDKCENCESDEGITFRYKGSLSYEFSDQSS